MSHHVVQTGVWLVVGLVHLALSLPPAIKERSVKRFVIALVLSVVGITLPVFIFVMSGFLVPDWKGGCKHGWIDCFIVGKLVLLPLVLWACAALYAAEIWRSQERNRPWIVLGLVVGAVVSGVSLVMGLFTLGVQVSGLVGWYSVPLYVVIWFGIRAYQGVRMADLGLRAYMWTGVGAAPFGAGALLIASKYYERLPNQPPSCFVVTAAMSGHEWLVGPRWIVRRGGEAREANQQLLTLWCLESIWAERLPASHAWFRRWYGKIGPVVARRIGHPLLADVVFVVVKPMEWTARVVLKAVVRKGEQ